MCSFIKVPSYFFITNPNVAVHGDFRLLDNETGNDEVFYTTGFRESMKLYKTIKRDLIGEFTTNVQLKYGIAFESDTCSMIVAIDLSIHSDFFHVSCNGTLSTSHAIVIQSICCIFGIQCFYVGDSDSKTFTNLKTLNFLNDDTMCALQIKKIRYVGITQDMIDNTLPNFQIFDSAIIKEFREIAEDPIIDNHLLEEYAKEITIINQRNLTNQKAKLVHVSSVPNIIHVVKPAIEPFLGERVEGNADYIAFNDAIKALSPY